MFHIANKSFHFIVLFIFTAVFSPVPESKAAEFIPVYTDLQETGFYDQTPLTDQVARGDINGRTLGEVRRKAFQNALDILESLIITSNDNGIRIQASFEDLGGVNERGGIILAGAVAAGFIVVEEPLVPGGVLTLPVALAEHLLARELNGNEVDVEIYFNERVPFYYGTGFTEPLGYVNFTVLVAHELLHGLGFLDSIRNDGSFERIQSQDGSIVTAIGPYDLNLYSEREEELLVHLSRSERQEAITSVDGLLWDGTLGGLATPSCAQLMGEALMDEYPSAVDSEGRPRLYAPNPWEQGSSVAHLAQASKDLMKPSHEGTEHARFTLGMLLDMFWTVGEVSPASLEILEDCLADSGEEPEPELEPESTARSGGGGGGCTISEPQNTQQNAMFNLFLILCALFSVLFYTNSMSISQVFNFTKRIEVFRQNKLNPTLFMSSRISPPDE